MNSHLNNEQSSRKWEILKHSVLNRSFPSKIFIQGSENPAEEETKCRREPNRMEDTRQQGLWKQHDWHTYEHIWTHRVCGSMGRPAQGKADWVSELRGKVDPKSFPKPELNSNWQLLGKIRLVFTNGVSLRIQIIIHLQWHIPCSALDVQNKLNSIFGWFLYVAWLSDLLINWLTFFCVWVHFWESVCISEILNVSVSVPSVLHLAETSKILTDLCVLLEMVDFSKILIF